MVGSMQSGEALNSWHLQKAAFQGTPMSNPSQLTTHSTLASLHLESLSQGQLNTSCLQTRQGWLKQEPKSVFM